MSEETLFTAIRRLMRELRICELKDGGTMSIDLLKAAQTVDIQMDKERQRQAKISEQLSGIKEGDPI